MPKYVPSSHAKFSKDQAQLIGDHLEAMPEITPEAIVDDASEPDSPLHQFFQWDDTEAARQWRLQEAGNLVRSVRVVVQTSSGTETTRGFLSVRVVRDDKEVREYKPIEIVRQEPILADQVMRDAMSALDAWKTKYEQCHDLFGPVVAAIDDVREKLKTG